MPFRVVDHQNVQAAAGDILLVRDNWNDWFVWITQFYAIVIAADGSRVEVGSVKIARVSMTEQEGRSHPPAQFDQLGEEWFSIGQTENYYETLNSLGDEYRDWYLAALRDCARDLDRLAQHEGEPVLSQSLLRDIDRERVQNRFHRLATGNAALTPFAFKFTFPADPLSPDPPPELAFRVTPGSHPPSNVHVLIGRNDVGKTRCFDLLSRTFLGLNARDGTPAGTLGPLEADAFGLLGGGHGFAGLVTVSFSPFDEYGPLVSASGTLAVRYEYVGLIRAVAQSTDAEGAAEPAPEAQQQFTIKGRRELCDEFVKSVEACRRGARRTRWSRALKVLEADPLFEEADVSAIAADGLVDWQQQARRLFRNLSSGHCVVLLTISKLVELVEERSLVLIDEPEGHLHPPLLSAFVRALSDLLVDRNGVAIIATHSPVVLQEVPKSCVWILNRSGLSSRTDRPDTETFGENVGVLTREVFGLEVVRTGFHRLISEAAEGRTYEEILDFFGGRLGAEGRGLARLLKLIPPSLPPDLPDEG